jgi:hypothetical protein
MNSTAKSTLTTRNSLYLTAKTRILDCQVVLHTELEFLWSLWGLGTEEEKGYRTGPPGNIGWRNSSLGIDSWAR